jgi:hypothetical protein
MTTETKLPTHLEAKSALDSLLNTFADSRLLGESEIHLATIGIAKSVQIRDYALGAISSALPIEDAVDFIKGLELLGENSAALQAVKSSILYEFEDKEGANSALDKALSLEHGHSLSLLLRRVYSAGWPSASFVAMRRELHPKVIEGLKDLEGVAVNETR